MFKFVVIIWIIPGIIGVLEWENFLKEDCPYSKDKITYKDWILCLLGPLLLVANAITISQAKNKNNEEVGVDKDQQYCYIVKTVRYAPVVELVDTSDLGSDAASMGVRVSPGVPTIQRQKMAINDKMVKVDETFNINRYDNGYMLEVTGRDSEDEWITTKTIVTDADELVALIKEVLNLPLNR